jgi:hypothetical protein
MKQKLKEKAGMAEAGYSADVKTVFDHGQFCVFLSKLEFVALCSPPDRSLLLMAIATRQTNKSKSPGRLT